MEPLFYIKARKKGERQWKFIERGGNLGRLRIHALMFEAEQAKTELERLRRYETVYDFKVQPI